MGGPGAGKKGNWLAASPRLHMGLTTVPLGPEIPQCGRGYIQEISLCLAIPKCDYILNGTLSPLMGLSHRGGGGKEGSCEKNLTISI